MASSGRALSASARQAGFEAHVLDWFADQDTGACSLSARRVGAPESGFDDEGLLDQTERLVASGNIAGIVIGSGFEDRVDLLEGLVQGRRVFGNPPRVVRRVKDPQAFFGVLRCLGIPHPETVWHDVTEPQGWLIKRIGAAGGLHVRPLGKDGRCPGGFYLQRRVPGRPFSALFLADGRRGLILGYNALWHAGGFEQSPFLYGGAVALPGMGTRTERQLTEAIQALVAAFGLRGLCGMDFVMDGDSRWCVLEVNPRPPATFELHEHAGRLFRAHVLACAGRLPQAYPEARCARAHGLLYATRTAPVASSGWPAWTTDRPAPGTRVSSGGPICTVQAQGADAASAKRLVMARLSRFDGMLGLWRSAA